MDENERVHRAQLGGRWCFKCATEKLDVDERYSFGVYAGKMCVECAKSGYIDSCGIGKPQGTPQEYVADGGEYYADEW